MYLQKCGILNKISVVLDYSFQKKSEHQCYMFSMLNTNIIIFFALKKRHYNHHNVK